MGERGDLDPAPRRSRGEPQRAATVTEGRFRPHAAAPGLGGGRAAVYVGGNVGSRGRAAAPAPLLRAPVGGPRVD